MEREPKQPIPSYEELKKELGSGSEEVDPKEFSKYLLWGLTRAGASKEEIEKAVSVYNEEFPECSLKKVDHGVSAEKGVNGGYGLSYEWVEGTIY